MQDHREKQGLLCGTASPKTVHSVKEIIGHVKTCIEYADKRRKTHEVMGFKQHTNVNIVIFCCGM